MALLCIPAGLGDTIAELQQDHPPNTLTRTAATPSLATMLIHNAWQNGWDALALGRIDAAVEHLSRASLLAYANHDAMAGVIREAERLTHQMRDLALQREHHRCARDVANIGVQELRTRLDGLLDAATDEHAESLLPQTGHWLTKLLTGRTRPRIADPTVTTALAFNTDRSTVAESQTPALTHADDSIRVLDSIVTKGIAIYLLGSFRVSIDGQPIERPASSRGRALLAFLALKGSLPVSRDQLMEAFWPDASPASARNSLNVALYHLRRALKSADLPELVHYADGDYSLDSTKGVWVDVNCFLQHAEDGRRHEQVGKADAAITAYERVVALYGDDFLSDSPYDEWAAMPREKMRLTYLDVLDRLSRLYLESSQYAACIAQCRRILEEDACREDAHALLMRCYVRQNQPHLALRQFQACATALKKELGVPPSSATLELHDRIRSGNPV